MVVGVSNETQAKVEPAIPQYNMNFPVAVGAGTKFSNRSLPHAWLIAADGRVVFSGHPKDIDKHQIRTELQRVRYIPRFKVEKGLESVQKHLMTHKLGKAVKALEKITTGENAEHANEAQLLIDTILTFGESQLARLEGFYSAGEYGDGMALLNLMSKAFAGSELAPEFKEKKKEWAKNKAVKAAVKAEALWYKHMELFASEDVKGAYAALQKIVNNKTLEGSAVHQKASKRAEELKGYL